MTGYRSLQDYTSDEIEERIKACELVAERERAAGHGADAIGALNHARNLRNELHQREQLLIKAGLGTDPVSIMVRKLSAEQCERIAADALRATYELLKRGRHSASSVRAFSKDLVALYEATRADCFGTGRSQHP